MMNAGYFDEPPPSVFSCFRDKCFCFGDDAFKGLSSCCGQLDRAFSPDCSRAFPPQETSEDQITSDVA